MNAPRWYVVRDEDCSYDIDDPKPEVWTLSLDPKEPGWDTDSGYPGYGLTKALAEELANAANAAWVKEQEAKEPFIYHVDENGYITVNFPDRQSK